jgi:hypothetical protein
MPSESLHDTPPTGAVVGSSEKADDADAETLSEEEAPAALPIDISEFSQRLASFGLGETPDPLLTESRPPSKRRPRP